MQGMALPPRTFPAYLISSLRIPLLGFGSTPASGDLTGIFGDHFSHSLSGSAASENSVSLGAGGASSPLSGVANAIAPVTSDSSDVLLGCPPPNKLTLNENPPAFQNLELVRTRSMYGPAIWMRISTAVASGAR